LSYFTPSVLKRNRHIYNSINMYSHKNFCLGILEDLGNYKDINKNFMLEREQYYLNILFIKYPKEN
jgi:hypothetical protein